MWDLLFSPAFLKITTVLLPGLGHTDSGKEKSDRNNESDDKNNVEVSSKDISLTSIELSHMQESIDTKHVVPSRVINPMMSKANADKTNGNSAINKSATNQGIGDEDLRRR